MTIDVSGFGLGVHLVASNTYPVGLPLSAFADDADPMDIPGIELAQVATPAALIEHEKKTKEDQH